MSNPKIRLVQKRKSNTSSLDPLIIQVASFKCRADVPLIMINKRGRCFNLDPVSPSKTLLERTSLAWKHGRQLQIFILKMVGSCFSWHCACCKHGSRTTLRPLLHLPLQGLACLVLPRLKYEPRCPEISSISL